MELLDNILMDMRNENMRESHISKIRDCVSEYYQNIKNYDESILLLCDLINKHEKNNSYYLAPFFLCIGSIIHKHCNIIDPLTIDVAYNVVYKHFAIYVDNLLVNKNSEFDENEDYWMPIKDIILSCPKYSSI